MSRLAGRRRRGVVLLLLALAAGGLAASEVGERTGEIEARVGPLVPVVVARADLPPGHELRGRALRRALGTRAVPAAYVPPDALGDPAEADGLRTAAAVAAGSYLTAGLLDAAGAGERSGLRAGERAVELSAAGGEALEGLGPGGRVDVLVTTERGDGRGRTFLALQSVEVLSLRAADPAAAPAGGGGEGGGDGAAAGTLATVRVTLRQALLLTAAQNFAREVRLLPRSPADRRRAGAMAVEGAALR